MEERRRNIQELLNTIDDNRELGEIARDVGREREKLLVLIFLIQEHHQKFLGEKVFLNYKTMKY